MKFLKNLFKTRKSPHSNSSTDEIAKEKDTSLHKYIFPVIKSVEDPSIISSANNNPIIKKNLAEGITICFVLDTESKFEYIHKSHLEKLDLEITELYDISIKNLKSDFYKNNNISKIDLSSDIPEAKPFYKVEMNANFPPSMMLIDEFWNKTILNFIKSKTIAVSLPAKNLFFVSDFNDTNSFRAMKIFGEHMYNASIQDSIPLSQNIYLRKDNEWTLFKEF